MILDFGNINLATVEEVKDIVKREINNNEKQRELQMSDSFLSYKQVIKYLSITSYTTLYKIINKYNIPVSDIGLKRIKKSDLDILMNSKKKKGHYEHTTQAR